MLLTRAKFPPDNCRAQPTLHWDPLSSGGHYLQTHSESLTYSTMVLHHISWQKAPLFRSSVFQNRSPVFGGGVSRSSVWNFYLLFSLAQIRCLWKRKFSWENGIPIGKSDLRQAKMLPALHFYGFSWFICPPNVCSSPWKWTNCCIAQINPSCCWNGATMSSRSK